MGAESSRWARARRIRRWLSPARSAQAGRTAAAACRAGQQAPVDLDMVVARVLAAVAAVLVPAAAAAVLVLARALGTASAPTCWC